MINDYELFKYFPDNSLLFLRFPDNALWRVNTTLEPVVAFAVTMKDSELKFTDIQQLL